MSFHNASRQFGENLRLFSDPQKEPEKYNLYAGLKNLADGLEDLEDSVRRLNINTRKLLLRT